MRLFHGDISRYTAPGHSQKDKSPIFFFVFSTIIIARYYYIELRGSLPRNTCNYTIHDVMRKEKLDCHMPEQCSAVSKRKISR